MEKKIDKETIKKLQESLLALDKKAVELDKAIQIVRQEIFEVIWNIAQIK